jgi:hypothetical protein
MIEYKYEISNEDGYVRHNHFEIHEALQTILREDYFLFNSEAYDKQELVEKLYKENFEDKYDRATQGQIFEQYIDNEKFKEKVFFIYSIIDEEKYKKFVAVNPELENPNELTVEYNIIDSDGVKVQLFNIAIADIAFVF